MISSSLKSFSNHFFIFFLIVGLLPNISHAASASNCAGINRFRAALCDGDNDGLSNKDEKRLGQNPRKADTDGDGIKDGDDDSNDNGIDDEDEKDNCSDLDSDGDGIADEDENEFGLNPKKADTDGDGIKDGNEKDSEGESLEDLDDDSNSCSKEDRDDNSTGGSTIPAPNKTPATAPTSAPSGNSCNSQRDTTGFGIPSGVIGHGNSGKNLWISYCMSCHGNSKKGSSYFSIQSSLSRSEMITVQSILSSVQNRADIAADRNCP